MLVRTGEVTQVENLPIRLSGTADPEAERDGVRSAFVVRNVNSVAADVELDASRLGKGGVKIIEVDNALVVNLQDGSVV
jgi:hypothetical protein